MRILPMHSRWLLLAALAKRACQVDRQGKDDRRALLTGDVKKSAEVAQLHRLRPLGKDVAGPRQPLCSLKLALSAAAASPAELVAHWWAFLATAGGEPGCSLDQPQLGARLRSWGPQGGHAAESH